MSTLVSNDTIAPPAHVVVLSEDKQQSLLKTVQAQDAFYAV